MGQTLLVNGHNWLSGGGANANLSQTTAFFAPAVFQLGDVASLDSLFGHHHPGM
jgi:hypothetical protein